MARRQTRRKYKEMLGRRLARRRGTGFPTRGLESATPFGQAVRLSHSFFADFLFASVFAPSRLGGSEFWLWPGNARLRHAFNIFSVVSASPW